MGLDEHFFFFQARFFSFSSFFSFSLSFLSRRRLFYPTPSLSFFHKLFFFCKSALQSKEKERKDEKKGKTLRLLSPSPPALVPSRSKNIKMKKKTHLRRAVPQTHDRARGADEALDRAAERGPSRGRDVGLFEVFFWKDGKKEVRGQKKNDNGKKIPCPFSFTLPVRRRRQAETVTGSYLAARIVSTLLTMLLSCCFVVVLVVMVMVKKRERAKKIPKNSKKTPSAPHPILFYLPVTVSLGASSAAAARPVSVGGPNAKNAPFFVFVDAASDAGLSTEEEEESEELAAAAPLSSKRRTAVVARTRALEEER